MRQLALCCALAALVLGGLPAAAASRRAPDRGEGRAGANPASLSEPEAAAAHIEGAGFAHLKAVAVYGGASPGSDPAFAKAAYAFGAYAAQHGVTLVTGGGNVGIMKAVTDGALANGGKVVGVSTRDLEQKEHLHPGLSETVLVTDQGQRKEGYLERAQAGVGLSGGAGTFGEIDYQVDRSQIHEWTGQGDIQPVGLLNTKGYHDARLAMYAHAIKEGFMNEKAFRELVLVHSEPAALLQALDQRLGELAARALRAKPTVAGQATPAATALSAKP